MARGNEQLCFLSGQVRTLVAMATYSSNRLIMGKVEIDFFFCLNGKHVFGFLFTEMFIYLLSSPLRFMRLFQIVEFEWLPGIIKGQFFV